MKTNSYYRMGPMAADEITFGLKNGSDVQFFPWELHRAITKKFLLSISIPSYKAFLLKHFILFIRRQLVNIMPISLQPV